ncbi:hypothetical protein APY04_3120 [Hyphomicrobium sulfonivorans]|uniref:Lipoprotein n=2 Tax=Hyphomicrobium sulfonivorans TaxID=121290 RepID=A0A109BA64_HYPSL|nr:hypothetical protein APY04_3120 [Hyphomicrobium sulfonivorans]
MRLGRIRALAVMATALLCGCAGSPSAPGPSLASDIPPASADSIVTGSVPPSPGYQLTAEELSFDCRKLTGTMQIRIMQLRGYNPDAQPSAIARGIRSVTTPIWGGTREGLDPDAQYSRERAMLDAYNERLASKNCKTFNIAAALADTSGATPEPFKAAPTN